METVKEVSKYELKIFKIVEDYYVGEEFRGWKCAYIAQLDDTEIAREYSFSELIKSLEDVCY